MQRPSNKTILIEKRWWSHNGFIDLESLPTKEKETISMYWFSTLRPAMFQKQMHLKEQIKKTKDNKLISRYMRRSQVIQLYDTLLKSNK